MNRQYSPSSPSSFPYSGDGHIVSSVDDVVDSSQEQEQQEEQDDVLDSYVVNNHHKLLDPPLMTKSVSTLATMIPKTKEEMLDVDNILAQEMENLSFAKREKIMFDIHGMYNKSSIEENDENKINELLNQLDIKLQKQPHKNKEAYDCAKYLNEDYVTNRKFRLMFLRSDDYNVNVTCERIIQHFHNKKELFGSGEILGRNIKLSDLSNDDMETINSGFMQVLPSRDVSGRPILAIAPRHRICKTNDNMARAFWYMSMSWLLCDEDIQKNGFICVIYHYGKKMVKNLVNELRFVQKIHSIRNGLPFKPMAIHSCVFDQSLKPFFSSIRLFFGKGLRTRVRDHYGTYKEIMFGMETYGINTNDHPFKEDWTLSLEFHHTWLKLRQNIEEDCCSNTNNNWDADDRNNNNIIVPRRFDVLFGRGKTTREHTGNLRTAHLVDMYYEQYNKSSKLQKTTLAEQIVKIVNESCGRFLKWNNDQNCWIEVDFETAREKVSHFFRQKRYKIVQEEKEKSSKLKRRVSPSSSSSSDDGDGDYSDNEKAPKRNAPSPIQVVAL